MRIFIIIILVGLGNYMSAQDFTASERLQGYANIDDSLYFIFDEKNYGIQPKNDYHYRNI